VLRRILAIWRRWRVRHDLYRDEPEKHPALAQVTKGEVFPWKGTLWRVMDVRAQPIPAVILVPSGETRASQVQLVRKLRRADRILTAQEAAARASLNRRASDR